MSTSIVKFFEAYPNESQYDSESVGAQLSDMAQAVKECRALAIEHRSLAGLRDAQTLDIELGVLYTVISRHRQNRSALRI